MWNKFEKQEVSCETTNREAGNCVQNEKLMHSFKNKYDENNQLKDENNQLKDEKKYEETVSTLIQRLGQTSRKLQILSKKTWKKWRYCEQTSWR